MIYSMISDKTSVKIGSVESFLCKKGKRTNEKRERNYTKNSSFPKTEMKLNVIKAKLKLTKAK